MNKSELIDAVTERTGLSKSDAQRTVETLFDPNDGVIVGALRQSDRVTITGFGTFEPRRREARKGRNPRTGEEIQIAASTSVAFRAGKGLKDSVNEAASSGTGTPTP